MSSNDSPKPQSSLRDFLSGKSWSKNSASKQPQRTPENEERPKLTSTSRGSRSPKKRGNSLQSSAARPSFETIPTLRLDIPNIPSSDHRLLDASSVDSR